jgi:hypothetical protein
MSVELLVPASLPPGERGFGIHWIRSLVDPGISMEGMEKRETLCHHQDYNSNPSAVQPIASLSTDCAKPAPHVNTLDFHKYQLHDLIPFFFFLFFSEYLQYNSCYRKVSKDWDFCANRFLERVNNSHTRAFDICW